MSHMAILKSRSRDLDALARAAAKCGGELVRDQKTHAWWGISVGDYNAENSALRNGVSRDQLGTCDHAIRLKGLPGENGQNGPWEVGVVDRPEGFALIYDNYYTAGKQLESACGVEMKTLLNHFAAEVAMAELSMDGFNVTGSHVDANGNVFVEMED